ncbi:MAG: pyridoxal 5'-phosphate synthase glutaminase subunit PdxT [Lachnospiraceae bacterium]
MKVAVLALQGAFIEHQQMLSQLGVHCVELRKSDDLNQAYDGLILPGGESTVQGKLLKELDMYDRLKRQIDEGLPVLATCAGMILLAKQTENDDRSYFQSLPVVVKRNAYGRQLGSFYTHGEVKGIGMVPMTFIRAPYISSVGKGVEVLSEVDGHIVAVSYQNQLAFSFHPELDEDLRIHQFFLDLIG